MDNGTKLQLSNNADREKVKFNKQLLIYLFFLLVSLSFWYLNALSKDYTTDIYYSVQYEDFPKGKVLITDLPPKIGLKIKGFGFSILRCKLSGYLKSLNLSLNQYPIEVLKKNNTTQYFLLTKYTKDYIASQFTNEIQLIEVKPDTLFLNLTDVVEKKVPVKLKVSLQFEKQYMQGIQLLTPDSVMISGPKTIIDTIEFAETRELKKKKVNDTILQTLELFPLNKITFHPNKISAIIPVFKYTELTFNVPIEAENVPDSLFLRTFPSSISLSCWVSLADYDKMSPFLFRAVVDYKSITNSQQAHNKLKISLIKTPANVTSVTFHPKSAEYLIEK